MGRLTESDVEKIRLLCWTESITFRQLAKQFDVTRLAIMHAAKGKSWPQLNDIYPPYIGDPRERLYEVEDEVEVMEQRADSLWYQEISESMEMEEHKIRSILKNPSPASQAMFMKRNGYTFVDGPYLSVGDTSVDDIIKILEMKYVGYTSKRIAAMTNLSVPYVEQIVYGKRGVGKLEMAMNYMDNAHGSNWKTWGNVYGRTE